MPIKEEFKLKLQQETLSLLKTGKIEKVILDIKRCDSHVKTWDDAIHLMDAYIEGMLTLVRDSDLESIKLCIQGYPRAKLNKLPKDTLFCLWATPIEIIIKNLPIEIYSDPNHRSSFEDMMVKIIHYIKQEKSYRWMLSETCVTGVCLFRRLTENAVLKNNFEFFEFMTHQITFSPNDLRAATDRFEFNYNHYKATAKSQSERDSIDRLRTILHQISHPVNTFDELEWFLHADNETWLHYLRIGNRLELVRTTVHHVMEVLPDTPLGDEHPFASLIRHTVTPTEINQYLVKIQQPPGFFSHRYTDKQIAIAAQLHATFQQKHPSSNVAPISSWALLAKCLTPKQASPGANGEENNLLLAKRDSKSKTF